MAGAHRIPNVHHFQVAGTAEIVAAGWFAVVMSQAQNTPQREAAVGCSNYGYNSYKVVG